ncbi:hypothetical protein FAGAP_11966 [Fusarium agapanthi]|uniref:1-acyldihydroxyacetone-phosphate reductase n=1 Tax=Fusarium agapanthi TaxID=1803897 RepID=A0A9P5B4N2_9HYPO|nr:hypothetical protein FAGAP_11966 [Fusarium agapanthi]
MSQSSKRSVLVTGCSQGSAGNALALQFAAEGFRVFATARSLKTLSNLAEAGIEILTLDVTQPESIAAVKSQIASRTGGSLHILFNNAGASSVPSGHEPTIINVASVLARLPSPFTSAYNATKAAVAAYSDTLRLEVRPLGIRVVTLYMGEVSTSLMTTDNINFGPESIYRDAEAAVKQRTVTHLEKTMPPKQFSREVVCEIVNGKRSFLWKGSNAFTVWLLNAVGPRTVFDSTMVKVARLDNKQTKASVFKQGQTAAGKMA